MSGVSIPVVEVSAVPENGYLLDVREEDEWRAGHAPNAVHIPLAVFARTFQRHPCVLPVQLSDSSRYDVAVNVSILITGIGAVASST